MSLTNPFASPTAPAGAPTAAPIPEPEPSGPSRRALLLAGALLAVIAAAAGAYLLLGGSSSDDVAMGVAPPRPRPAAVAPTAAPSIAPTAITVRAAVTARNPFVPLVAASAAGTPGGAALPGGSPTAVPSSPVPSSPVGSAPVVPVTPLNRSIPAPVVPLPAVSLPPALPPVVPVAPVPGAGPVRPVASDLTVRMGTVAADNRVAQVTVGSKTELVQPGQKLGGFTLVNLRDGRCGAVQHGTVVFDLCEGASRSLG